MTQNIIVWFRQDLRLKDHPALWSAVAQGAVLPLYIIDPEITPRGGASKWWLHHSLRNLAQSLKGHLIIEKGNALQIISNLVDQYQITACHVSRSYDPSQVNQDQQISDYLQTKSVRFEKFNGSVLWEPEQIQKADKSAYRVFTPYFRKGCLMAEPPRSPLPAPTNCQFLGEACNIDSVLQQYLPLPTIRWDEPLAQEWQSDQQMIGEAGADHRLQLFLQNGLDGYKQGRDFPVKAHVSRLSPHLHFGEISPHQIWDQLQPMPASKDKDHFCSELGWREFSHYLLHHQPNLPQHALQPKFRKFPWQENPDYLKAWQNGKTGIPIVDAGMRELWQTGYMHNRVRMIVGSFLVKNLLLPWQQGAAWFWDCLVDADLANNSASWQWIAGCGADAAPYFRIFNPVLQAEKFDPSGEYIRKYIPEISKLPLKFLVKPWLASPLILQEAGIILGQDYPLPIVDLKESRQLALTAFQSLKDETL